MIGLNREIDVNIQSQTSPTIDYLLINELKTDCALSQPINKDDTIVNLVAGHGFTGAAGEMFTIFYNDRLEQLAVVSVATNAVTLEMPIASDYPISGPIIVRGNCLMNVDGSTTPVTFRLKPRGTQPVDFATLYLLAQSGSNVPDDGNFMGIAAVTKGMYMRQVDGFSYNRGNYKNNQDFKRHGAIVIYSTKATSGTNATDVVFKLEEIYGQVARLDPRTDDELIVVVRDNLTGLAKLTAPACGSYTSGE